MAREIRLAVAGVGNTAATFLQGILRYGPNPHEPGLWHPEVGGYAVEDLVLVGAFDIRSEKVGMDLSVAAFTPPNVVPRYVPLRRLGVEVSPGILLDPLPDAVSGETKMDKDGIEGIIGALQRCKADVLVNLISSGLDRTSRAYAEVALKAGCNFVNATPSPLVSEATLVEKFHSSGLVIVGDDLMTQLGGTAFHRGILGFMTRRGVNLVRSYQLDVGGGEETLNTLNENVKAAKRQVKTAAISSEVPYAFDTVAGTTDYVDYLGDRRTSYFWIEGEGFLREPVRIDIYLKTSDGANAGNILLDVTRGVQASRDRGTYGAPNDLCGYGFKSPPRAVGIEQSTARFLERYIKPEGERSSELR